MSLRSGLLTLAFVFTGALAFIFVALCTVVVLAGRDSGVAFDDSAGATPATASNEANQVALRQRSGARGEGSTGVDPIALVAEARAFLRKEILGD